MGWTTREVGFSTEEGEGRTRSHISTFWRGMVGGRSREYIEERGTNRLLEEGFSFEEEGCRVGVQGLESFRPNLVNPSSSSGGDVIELEFAMSKGKCDIDDHIHGTFGIRNQCAHNPGFSSRAHPDNRY